MQKHKWYNNRHMTLTCDFWSVLFRFKHFDNSKSSCVVLQFCETLREPTVKKQHSSVLVIKWDMERSWTVSDTVAKFEREVRRAPCRASSCNRHFELVSYWKLNYSPYRAVRTMRLCPLYFVVFFCLFMYLFWEFGGFSNLGRVYTIQFKNLYGIHMVGIFRTTKK